MALILTLILSFVFLALKIKQKQSINDESGRKYCTASSRNAEVCIEIYEPVCGFPFERTYSNSCFACMDEIVEYYVFGECPD